LKEAGIKIPEVFTSKISWDIVVVKPDDISDDEMLKEVEKLP